MQEKDPWISVPCPGEYLGELVMHQVGREIRLPPGRRDTVFLSRAALSLHAKTPLLMPLLSPSALASPCSHPAGDWCTLFFTKSIGILSLAKLQGHFPCTPKGKAGRGAPGRAWVPFWWAALSPLHKSWLQKWLCTAHNLENRLRLKISQHGQYPCCISFSLFFSPHFPVLPVPLLVIAAEM